MKFTFQRMDWKYAAAFRISYRTRTHARTVVVHVENNGCVGRGAAAGVSYHGETAETLLAQLAAVARAVNGGITRADLQHLLPAGGARNALDCALWDLEAKHSGRRVWDLCGIFAARPLTTAYTLSLDTPEAMGSAAAAAANYSLLKVKLNGEGDLERIICIREARPDAVLIVDANQAWSERQLGGLTPRLASLGVMLVEQPLPVGQDDALAGFNSPVPICADESCQGAESLASLAGKYQYVNIKLDKTGGLTEALRTATVARSSGFKLMVGCMGGSSLSMAPAFVLGQLCDVVDLDSPLLLKGDVAHAIRYEGSRMHLPSAALWG